MEHERSRLRQALVCPYCKDEVSRKGTVICSRRGCGAVYHRECWKDCVAHYGGCAVYGCASTRARRVSFPEYLVRVVRLLVAVVLFPPRVVRSIERAHGARFREVYRRSLAKASGLHFSLTTAEAYSGVKRLYLNTAMLSSVCGLSLLLMSKRFWQTLPLLAPSLGGTLLVVFGVILACALGPLLVPYFTALGVSLGFYSVRAVAGAFRGEVAALARVDERITVIERIRQGATRKK